MRKLWILGFAALLLWGCRTSAPSNAPVPAPEPFTRVANPDTNTVQLQVAVRRLVPVHRDGPVIWLVGTTHVGEPEYYHALQKFLNAQTLVLFEGVHTDAHPRHVRDGARANDSSQPAANAAPGDQPNFSMQGEMAKALGLVFQLDSIDYTRRNFYNSDLSITEIQRLISAEAPPATTTAPAAGQGNRGNPTFDSLLQVMDGNSLLGSMFKLGLQFIGSSPKLQGMAKLTLIDTIGGLEGDLSDLREMPPEWQQILKVLIASRNQHVITDMKTAMKRVPHNGSIAIFYGTAHMDDMQRRMEREFGYRPYGDLWFPAFSVNLAKSGISPAEAQAAASLVKLQLRQLEQ